MDNATIIANATFAAVLSDKQYSDASGARDDAHATLALACWENLPKTTVRKLAKAIEDAFATANAENGTDLKGYGKDTYAYYAIAGIVTSRDVEGRSSTLDLVRAVNSAIDNGTARDAVRDICKASATVSEAIAALRELGKTEKSDAEKRLAWLKASRSNLGKVEVSDVAPLTDVEREILAEIAGMVAMLTK